MDSNSPFLLHTDLATSSEVGMEGLNIEKVSSYFSGYVANLTSMLTLKALPASLIKSDCDKASVVISKLQRTDLEHFTIYTPEYINGNLIPYLTHLNLILNSLEGICTNLIKPLNDWALNMATTPGYSEKIWMLPTFNNEVESNTNILQGFFNQSAGKDIADAGKELKGGFTEGLASSAKNIEQVFKSVGNIIIRLG